MACFPAFRSCVVLGDPEEARTNRQWWLGRRRVKASGRSDNHTFYGVRTIRRNVSSQWDPGKLRSFDLMSSRVLSSISEKG
jgi:hypothetical protein